MAKSKRTDFVCPECLGAKQKLYLDQNGEHLDECEFCFGTGVYSDCDTEEKFLGRYDFSG